MLTKFTTSSTDQQTQFSTDQDSRRTEFANFQRDSQQKVFTLLGEYEGKLKEHDAHFLNKEKEAEETHTTNLETLRVNSENAASAILEEMRRHKAEIESLVGVIGNLGVTSGYKKVADQARWMLYAWQFITVLALAGLVGVAYFVAYPKGRDVGAAPASVQLQATLPQSTKQVSDKDGKDKRADSLNDARNTSAQSSSGSASDSDFYHGLATRIFLSLTFGIFATYAGRQASRFFSIEQRNRKLALELEALGPFIEPLDKMERDKFRVQIGDRSFGVPEHEASRPKEDDPVTLVDLIKSKEFREALADQVKDAVKGAK